MTGKDTYSRKGTSLWYNGSIMPCDEVRISPFSHGLHYGTGVFEGIRTYKQKSGGSAIFRLGEHIDRLINSARILGIQLPYDRASLMDACLQVCLVNEFEECYVRPIAYITEGPLGVNPGPNPPIDTLILCWEWGAYLGEKAMREGVQAKTSSFIRPHPNSLMTKGKITGQYVTSVLARCEVSRLGYDEALFLDPQGYLAEGTGENLFMIKDGKVKTAPLTSVLAGVTRAFVLEYFKSMGNPVVEVPFTRDELWCADEAFLTGTAAEVSPIREVDDRPIGLGKPGPITLALKQAYAEIVRGDLPSYAKNWLTTYRVKKRS